MTAVTTTIDGAIAVIRVDNPPVNALSDVVLDGIVAALGSIPPSPEVRAVVLTGTGKKAFLAGADLSEFGAMVDSPGRIGDHVARTRRVLDELARLDVPVIAAVQGLALGGGLEFAARHGARPVPGRGADHDRPVAVGGGGRRTGPGDPGHQRRDRLRRSHRLGQRPGGRARRRRASGEARRANRRRPVASGGAGARTAGVPGHAGQ
ncbi:MAG: enoyl-CoA hydratase/isomerase family protein [Actinobacteria bacterium]|nr:MAG: enoyl-CoA hydratase/isomerase family protein [Actinomycetota bacterium]